VGLHRMGENLCQLYILQGLDSQNMQGTQKTKLPKNQWPSEEMGKWTAQSFFKGINSNGQETHEEMLTILGLKQNANQNPVKIPPHSF
jgi:hypothetical protein